MCFVFDGRSDFLGSGGGETEIDGGDGHVDIVQVRIGELQNQESTSFGILYM